VHTSEAILDDFHRFVDINLWGVVHGSIMFLPELKKRPEANLVNVASYAGILGSARVAGYCTSKFAARGFTESLRMEFAGTPLAVSLVLPGVTRTALMANSPLVDPQDKAALQARFDKAPGVGPERVARSIVSGIARNRPRILVGSDTRAIDLVVRALPGGYTRLMYRPMGVVFRRIFG